MNRREFVKLLFTGASLAAIRPLWRFRDARADDAIGSVIKTDNEWKSVLSPEAYDVMRHEGTERPFTSSLLNEHRDGTFACIACDLPLFPSKYKFDSGTGWPSFYDVLPGHIKTKEDDSMLMQRTEYHCARCGGHHGHVFNDGPAPTGLRYCNNGAALKFIPA